MKDYPNREALRKAHDIYRDAMRSFIIRCLRKVRGEQVEDLIRDSLPYEEAEQFKEDLQAHNGNIEAAIDIKHFPHIIRRYWRRDRVFSQQFNSNSKVQYKTGTIVDGRNLWAHPGVEDLDSERTRAALTHVAEVLGEINNRDAKREVEDIRDRLFSHEEEEHPIEVENADLKERLAEMSNQLAAMKTEKADCEKRLEVEKAEYAELLDTVEKEKIDIEKQLNELKAENVALEKLPLEKENRLKTVESESGKRIKTSSERLRTVEVEKTGLEEHLKNLLKQPKTLKTGLEEHLKNLLKQPKTLKTLEDRVEIGRKVAELRINAAGSKPLAWEKIREKLGLRYDEFHKGIRLEDHFQESVVERIESFEDGWEYGGKLEVLLGFEPAVELANRIEACKPKPAAKREAKRSPKFQRKWRRPGAVAALRNPTEIREAEARIARILNPSEKSRLECELCEAKRAMDGS